MTEYFDRTYCLVVEDQALIAMSLEAYLEDMGFHVCGPLSSLAEACAWLDESTPTVALLDYMLKDGPATDLARELRKRGVPFLVYSGYPRGPDVPSEFEDVPWLEKPVARQDLLTALAKLRRRLRTGLSPAPVPSVPSG